MSRTSEPVENHQVYQHTYGNHRGEDRENGAEQLFEEIMPPQNPKFDEKQ